MPEPKPAKVDWIREQPLPHLSVTERYTVSVEAKAGVP